MGDPDDWFTDYDSGAFGSTEVPSTQTAQASRWFAKWAGALEFRASYLGIGAVALVAVSFLFPWYTARVGEATWRIGATSPWLLGFFAFSWSASVAISARILRTDKLWGFGAISLIILGCVDLLHVAFILTFRSLFSWIAGLVNGLADSGTVELSIGLGSLLHIVAGLAAVGAGVMAFRPRWRLGRGGAA